MSVRSPDLVSFICEKCFYEDSKIDLGGFKISPVDPSCLRWPWLTLEGNVIIGNFDYRCHSCLVGCRRVYPVKSVNLELMKHVKEIQKRSNIINELLN